MENYTKTTLFEQPIRRDRDDSATGCEYGTRARRNGRR